MILSRLTKYKLVTDTTLKHIILIIKTNGYYSKI